jgi:hypothetical protein
MISPSARINLLGRKRLTLRSMRAIMTLYGLALGELLPPAAARPTHYRVDLYPVLMWPLRGGAWLLTSLMPQRCWVSSIATRREFVAALEALGLIMPLH